MSSTPPVTPSPWSALASALKADFVKQAGYPSTLLTPDELEYLVPLEPDRPVARITWEVSGADHEANDFGVVHAAHVMTASGATGFHLPTLDRTDADDIWENLDAALAPLEQFGVQLSTDGCGTFDNTRFAMEGCEGAGAHPFIVILQPTEAQREADPRWARAYDAHVAISKAEADEAHR